MKTFRRFMAMMFTLSAVTSTMAGGGSSSFQSMGLRLLNQAPALAQVITSKFEIRELGVLGPSDAPFDGRKLYTYMDFFGTAAEDETQSINPDQTSFRREHG